MDVKQHWTNVSVTHLCVLNDLVIRNKQILQLVAYRGNICVRAISCDQWKWGFTIRDTLTASMKIEYNLQRQNSKKRNKKKKRRRKLGRRGGGGGGGGEVGGRGQIWGRGLHDPSSIPVTVGPTEAWSWRRVYKNGCPGRLTRDVGKSSSVTPHFHLKGLPWWQSFVSRSRAALAFADWYTLYEEISVF